MVFIIQCVYWDTISRKTATQGCSVLSAHKADYPLADANPVFHSLGDIVTIIIVAITTLFLLFVLFLFAVFLFNVSSALRLWLFLQKKILRECLNGF